MGRLDDSLAIDDSLAKSRGTVKWDAASKFMQVLLKINSFG